MLLNLYANLQCKTWALWTREGILLSCLVPSTFTSTFTIPLDEEVLRVAATSSSSTFLLSYRQNVLLHEASALATGEQTLLQIKHV